MANYTQIITTSEEQSVAQICKEFDTNRKRVREHVLIAKVPIFDNLPSTGSATES